MSNSVCTTPVIIIHGGAWKLPDHMHHPSIEGVKRAAVRGYMTLIAGPTIAPANDGPLSPVHINPADPVHHHHDKLCLDAVEESVRELESNDVFDAGRGSCLTRAGTVEMDSAIMSCVRGVKKPRLGGIAAVSRVEHAVSGARAVLEQGEHALMVGEGAEDFLKLESSVKLLHDPLTLVTEQMKRDLDTFHSNYDEAVAQLFGHDTVGAVALDGRGQIACATSTGGITGKRVGRVGDSPIVGAGLYAQTDLGAAVATGHGESILRACLCKHAIQGIAAKQGASQEEGCLTEAVKDALEFMEDMTSGATDGGGGVIALHVNGEWSAQFSTVHMPWACVDADGMLHAGLNPGEAIQYGHYTDLGYDFDGDEA